LVKPEISEERSVASVKWRERKRHRDQSERPSSMNLSTVERFHDEARNGIPWSASPVATLTTPISSDFIHNSRREPWVRPASAAYFGSQKNIFSGVAIRAGIRKSARQTVPRVLDLFTLRSRYVFEFDKL
jgi:hypothetical protein